MTRVGDRWTEVGDGVLVRRHAELDLSTGLVLGERSCLVVDTRVELDLGGRRVLLAHLGAGHTDHDLVVSVPDTRVLFAGDLVEQGARPPSRTPIRCTGRPPSPPCSRSAPPWWCPATGSRWTPRS